MYHHYFFVNIFVVCWSTLPWAPFWNLLVPNNRCWDYEVIGGSVVVYCLADFQLPRPLILRHLQPPRGVRGFIPFPSLVGLGIWNFEQVTLNSLEWRSYCSFHQRIRHSKSGYNAGLELDAPEDGSIHIQKISWKRVRKTEQEPAFRSNLSLYYLYYIDYKFTIKYKYGPRRTGVSHLGFQSVDRELLASECE